jgi:hypothetical protein
MNRDDDFAFDLESNYSFSAVRSLFLNPTREKFSPRIASSDLEFVLIQENSIIHFLTTNYGLKPVP